MPLGFDFEMMMGTTEAVAARQEQRRDRSKGGRRRTTDLHSNLNTTQHSGNLNTSSYWEENCEKRDRWVKAAKGLQASEWSVLDWTRFCFEYCV